MENLEKKGGEKSIPKGLGAIFRDYRKPVGRGRIRDCSVGKTLKGVSLENCFLATIISLRGGKVL